MAGDSALTSHPPVQSGKLRDRRVAVLEFLRKPGVAVGLLVAFTFLVGVVNQRECSSIDESYQYEASQHPILYIATHDPQGHPFYAILVHLATPLYWPGAPIGPVRLPAFFAGMLIPLVFYLTNRRWAGHQAAILVATILVVMDPTRFYMSVGRGYSLQVLGVLVLNWLVLSTLRRGGWARGALYLLVGTATCHTHLWTLALLGAHGLFLALEVLRTKGKGIVGRRALGMMAAVGGTIGVALAVHLPMLDVLLAVAGRKDARPPLAAIVDAVLQLPRFTGWTVAAWLLLVPILLEGLARRPLRFRINRAGRLYLATIVVMCVWSAAVRSSYFGSRYLLCMLPGAAGLVAWGFSGYWRGRTAGRRLPVLQRPATWLIGLGLGVLSANASAPHEIWGTVFKDGQGQDTWYCFRALPCWIGDPAALTVLAFGILGLLIGDRFGRRRRASEREDSVLSAFVVTGVLLASLVPLVLGAAFSRPLFEIHMIAVAAVLLDAWEHRFSNRHLRALQPAFLISAAIAVTWQANIVMPVLTPGVLLRVAMYVPLLLIVLPLVRTTGPACADGDGS